MFEQATLTNGPARTRAWTTFLGLSSQVGLVALAVLTPMVWPQVLPGTHLWESLAPPLPPGSHRAAGKPKQEPVRVKMLKPAPWSLAKYQPASVPTRVYALIEEPDAGPAVVGSLGVDSGGPGDGVVGSILSQLTDRAGRVTPPPVAAPAPKAAPDSAPAIPRYVQGGNVRLGQVLHKAEPPYPQIAKTAHISGVVELECVVGTDGHIHEVKVKSGNPLLVRAAVDAAWQWVYAPTRLNGVPIEIVTILTFSFKLN
jgi:TonB family protein